MSLPTYAYPSDSVVSRSELMIALSHALDLTEGMPEGHAQRACWIGMHVGFELGLDAQQLDDLYYAVLLKDAGCSSNAARIFSLYATDDRALKRDFKHIDSDRFYELAKFTWSHIGVGESWQDRLKRLLHLANSGSDVGQELFVTRCEQGADIVRQLGFSDAVCDAIRALDEHWNGKGSPYGLAGEQIPLLAQIALLAQVVDVFFSIGGPKAAMDVVAQRSGSWFSPALVNVFLRVGLRADMWDGLSSPELSVMLMALEPANQVVMLGGEELDRLAGAFAAVVDAKSPYTFGHSSRVSQYTVRIAGYLGYTGDDLSWLRHAALLHDIGKLGVSNSILDKPGRLTEQEYEQVKLHPVHSHAILMKVNVFSSLAPIASGHHERLDGKGYPWGLKGDQIDFATRLISVADVFDAVSAERPYRAAMPVAEAFSILDSMVGDALDGDLVKALKASL